NRTLRFNNLLDAFVAGSFMVLVVAILLLSVYEWLLLLLRKRLAILHESNPVWLPEYALAEGGKPATILSALAITLALLRHLSDEAYVNRAENDPRVRTECSCPAPTRI